MAKFFIHRPIFAAALKAAEQCARFDIAELSAARRVSTINREFTKNFSQT
ncbi:MAG: hypothetical protein SR3Q1_07135 [Quinella sp. 3Q1]|nr:hypothetical protein [Quinella sp. 3Q1]MBR6887417.1 hypothetical protein [Selenomonadaceae bacterium]